MNVLIAAIVETQMHGLAHIIARELPRCALGPYRSMPTQEKAGRRILRGLLHMERTREIHRPATRLLLKNVCLTHMDGTENHSLTICSRAHARHTHEIQIKS